MNTAWSTKRKVIYASAAVFFTVAALLYVFRDTFFPKPSCFDGRQNGYEAGVDCGGTCSLRCVEQVVPLSVLWSRALQTSSSTYDLVAMVSNRNLDNAPRNIAYIFTAYDDAGIAFYTQRSQSIVPIDGDFPIVIQNVALTKRPAEVHVELGQGVPHYKVLEKPSMPTLRISDTYYEPGSIPRVYSSITNTKRLPLSDLQVRVVLYDAEGNAYGTGETVIPRLGKEETKNIVFTWNRAFSEAPTKIRVYPILDPFLGSL